MLYRVVLLSFSLEGDPHTNLITESGLTNRLENWHLPFSKRKNLKKEVPELYELRQRYKINLRFPIHELEVGKLAEEAGITHISLSHQIIPMIKAVPRGLTGWSLIFDLLILFSNNIYLLLACVDGYLTPKIKDYIAGFTSAFSSPPPVQFMQSDGGLCDVSRFVYCHILRDR